MTEHRRQINPVHKRVPAWLAERQLASIPNDTRPLTGRLLGDPLPGRSALDRRTDSDNRGQRT